MIVCIIGANGSMGKRYQAMLKYMKIPFSCVDKDNEESVYLNAKLASHAIICTPTETHAKFAYIIPKTTKILCEKPFTKDLSELDHFKDCTMMYQYSEISPLYTDGISLYDYFRHGNDGLVWDCFQIISLARGGIILDEQSPIWSCIVNGRYLSLADMDYAYMRYLEKWLKNQLPFTFEYWKEAHQKVANYEKSFNRDTGPFD